MRSRDPQIANRRRRTNARGVGRFVVPLANEQKGTVMKKLSLHKVVTLAAVLAMGSVSIAGEALATGGGVNCYDGEALVMGGSCRANDDVNPKQVKKQSNMTARSYKGAERYR
jgi:hypothetical protein